MQPGDKTVLYRIIPAALLFGAWFALVLMGMTEVGAFVGAVQAALFGMGVYHTTKPGKGD